MTDNTILLIDDNVEQCQKLNTILEFLDRGHGLIADCDNWPDLLDVNDSVDAVILGSCETSDRREQIIGDLHQRVPEKPLLLLVDESDDQEKWKGEDTPVFECIELPLRHHRLDNALERVFRQQDNSKQSNAQNHQPMELFRSLVGNSRAIGRVRKMIEQVANSDANVLILGESGTGKEVVARNLHYHSNRNNKPFVPVNCGAIPGDLLESELFGHEKGAFTGAISSRQGRFEMAEGGTLFLDEIGDMSLTMQVKLLRVLQEKTFERVGSNKSIIADVRIIAATHKNLEDAIKDGGFREDLYYRLNVFPISMPPLRERIEDIPLLVNELIARFEHEGRGSVRLTPAAVVALCQYGWPGNVRELSNMIERLIILYPYGVVDVQDLPDKFQVKGVSTKMTIPHIPEDILPPTSFEENPRLPKEGINLKEHLNNLEYNFIKQALDECDGVVAHAANRLHMRRTTLVEKMRKLGFQRAE